MNNINLNPFFNWSLIVICFTICIRFLLGYLLEDLDEKKEIQKSRLRIKEIKEKNKLQVRIERRKKRKDRINKMVAFFKPKKKKVEEVKK